MPICQCIFSQADIRNPHSLRSSTPNNCHPVKQISRQPASFYVKTATGVSSAAVLLYSSSRHNSCISLITKIKQAGIPAADFPTCFIIRSFFISVNMNCEIKEPTPSHNFSVYKSLRQLPQLSPSQSAHPSPDNTWWKKQFLRHSHISPLLWYLQGF